MLFKDFKDHKLNEESQRELGLSTTLKEDFLPSETYVLFPAVEDFDKATPWVVGSDQPEYKAIQAAIKARIARADEANENSVEEENNSTVPAYKENNESTPLFTEHLAKRNGGIYYLNEDENAIVDENVQLFEKEYDGKLSNLDEGFFGKLLGGTAGFLMGPSIGRIIAKALGIEKGILFDMFNSRLVGAALGAAIAKSMGNKGKQ